ncbi:MAG TPA: glutamine--fructose-6-phosphate transaminase (isomerizing) [bacterium]|nr:glutamine--fructose-6-phosphate transaminase (isomerizing) [bacterium]
MCGIVGYIGKQPALPILLAGLEKLEYRGYDSAGVAIYDGSQVVIEKKVGKLQALKDHLVDTPLKGSLGIGHTRWATHGGVTDYNAHPHASCDGRLVVIHNGIIENYQAIRRDLLQKKHKFVSETDTEVLAHLIEEEYKQLPASANHLTDAVRRALNQVEGGYAIVVINADSPDIMIAARMHNPLIIGKGVGENFVASDVPALLEHTKTVYDLKNGEIAEISAEKVNVTDLHGREVCCEMRKITWDAQQAEKGGYPHFLIKEIHETPSVLADVLRGRIEKKENAVSFSPDTLGLSGLDMKKISKIILMGCGSAYYACLYGKYIFEKLTQITTEAVVGSEYRYHQPIIDSETMVIALSQSGETADTLASLTVAKAMQPLRTIGLINALGSSMTREVDAVCTLQAGPEISVASTKVFSAMITNLLLIALYVAQQKKSCAIADITEEMLAMPDSTNMVLQQEDEIARIATFYINHQSAYYIGRDVNYPAALEGAQKLKELSYIHAEAYPAGELKHGPNAVIYPGFPVICLAPQGRVYKKMISNIQEMKAREAQILAFATIGDTDIREHADHVIYLPQCSEQLSVVYATIAMQLFAYYVTLYKGFSIDNPRALQKTYPKPGMITDIPKSIDIDKPRNLAKSVTVE